MKITSAYLDTETVQYWVNGSMLTAQMLLATARQMVDDGRAFIITSQAIGAITDGKRNA